MKKIFFILVFLISFSVLFSIQWPWERTFANPNVYLPQISLKNLNNTDVDVYDFGRILL